MGTRGKRQRAAPKKARMMPKKEDEAAAPVRKVPIMGYFGSDFEGEFYARPSEFCVPPTFPVTPSTVIREIRGDSLGSWLNGWLVVYDELRLPPTPDLFGKLCVVLLTDDRILAKELQP